MSVSIRASGNQQEMKYETHIAISSENEIVGISDRYSHHVRSSLELAYPHGLTDVIASQMTTMTLPTGV